MIVYTVIPFYSDGIEIFENEIKSFTDIEDALMYANNEICGRQYFISENELIVNNFQK